MATDRVQVLNTWPSMFGVRVLIALKLKGVEYEYQEEDLPNHKSQLLLKSNPIHKKIPVLIHNGKPICESLIIVQYIDEAWSSSDKPILAKDPYELALARFWADYVDKKIYEAGSRIFKSSPGDERKKAKEDFLEVMQTLDGALREVSGGGPYFGGQQIGLVDIALAPFLCWFEAYETLGEFKIWEGLNCPHLHKWADTVLECPSVKEAISISPSSKVRDHAVMLRKKYEASN